MYGRIICEVCDAFICMYAQLINTLGIHRILVCPMCSKKQTSPKLKFDD
jgi:hypothetical protein